MAYYKISKETIAEFAMKFDSAMDYAFKHAYEWYERQYDYNIRQRDYEISNIGDVYDPDKLAGMINDRYATTITKCERKYKQMCDSYKSKADDYKFFLDVLDFTEFDSSYCGKIVYLNFKDYTINAVEDSSVPSDTFRFKVIDGFIGEDEIYCAAVKIKVDRYN